MVHVGNNIARLRGFRLLTQKDMASKLGITQQEYSRLESKARLEDEQMERIAEALDFPIEMIKELESTGLLNIHNSGSITESVFVQYNTDSKVAELYERMMENYEKRLNEKDQVIKMLQELHKSA